MKLIKFEELKPHLIEDYDLDENVYYYSIPDNYALLIDFDEVDQIIYDPENYPNEYEIAFIIGPSTNWKVDELLAVDLTKNEKII